MNVKDRSENAFDTIRIRGKWWIPAGTAKSKEVSGELRFEVGSGGVLDLDDALSDDYRNIPILHGLSSQGECVTIFNGLTVGLPMNGNSIGLFRREAIAFYDMWVGNQLFNCKEEVRFKEYSFGIHNIENWADQHCFSPPRTQNRKRTSERTSVLYKSPKPILLFQDESMTIHLDAFHSGPSYSLGQLEASIQHFPRIVISSKDGELPYYGKDGTISDREWMIFVLIALLMGTVTWKFGFEGLIAPLHITDNKFSDEIAVRHYFHSGFGEVAPSKHSTHFELFFPYAMIGTQFPNIAQAFSKLFHDNESQIEVLYRFQCSKKEFDVSTLPNLLFAFEELEKNLLSKKNALFEKQGRARAKRIQSKLKPYCTKNEWKWVEAKLGWQGLSYSKRFRIAFQAMNTIYPKLDDEIEESLIKYLSVSRNNYAHAAKSTSDNYSLYVHATYWMAEFMTLMLLRVCGMSSKKIKRIFFRKLGPKRGQTNPFFHLFAQSLSSESQK